MKPIQQFFSSHRFMIFGVAALCSFHVARGMENPDPVEKNTDGAPPTQQKIDKNRTMSLITKACFGGATWGGTERTPHAQFILQCLLQLDPQDKSVRMSTLGADYSGTVIREIDSTIQQIARRAAVARKVNLTIPLISKGLPLAPLTEPNDFESAYTFFKDHDPLNVPELVWTTYGYQAPHSPPVVKDQPTEGLHDLIQYKLDTGDMATLRTVLTFAGSNPELYKQISASTWAKALELIDQEDQDSANMLAYHAQLVKQHLTRNKQLRETILRARPRFADDDPNLLETQDDSRSVPFQIMDCVAQQLGIRRGSGQRSSSSASDDGDKFSTPVASPSVASTPASSSTDSAPKAKKKKK